jgi:3-dehydroquinate synthase
LVQDVVKLVNSRDENELSNLPIDSCKVIVEDGIILSNERLEDLLRGVLGNYDNHKPQTSFALITDRNVRRLYGSSVVPKFSKIAKTKTIALMPGEKTKTFQRSSKILTELAKFRMDRDGIIVLLGGGVVGDIGGFVASIYKRGVRYIQVPTTLLAQIDSSIGGKTGVDTEWGKNQVGTIYQPSAVLIDPRFLRTLPRSQLLNGIGEMVKYGVIADRVIFEKLEHAKDFGSSRNLVSLIEPCAKIKAGIVSKDEHEQNMRSQLNFGHTVAHAIESASDYRISHGQSVLMGMISESWIAKELSFLNQDDYERIVDLINKVFSGFLVARSFFRLEESKLVQFALGDKKNSGGRLRMSLPEKIGKMHTTKDGSYKIPVPIDLFKGSIIESRRKIKASSNS